ncbi:hypothetical protein BASA62_006982 [Batrachochytrium salamandrivorans]|nr:hypothetical protein BASA62_006982 [Batrachochytrium salamandrivorans]
MTIMAFYWFVEQEIQITRVVLWKRADEEQEGSEPSGSGASGGGSSPNLPSDNNGLGNPGKPQRSAKGFGASLKKGLGQSKAEIRSFLAAYNNQDNGPFFFIYPKRQRSGAIDPRNERVTSTAKKNAKAHLRSINAAIIRLTKNPRKVIDGAKGYSHLLSRMKNMDNSAHLKVTETHIHRVKDDNTLASKALKGSKRQVRHSMARFKDYASSEKPRVASKLKRREKVKGGSSAGATSNQEETPN